MFTRVRCRSILLAGLVCAGLSLLVSSAGAQERPDASRLLPDNTLAFVRVANMPDLITRFQDTMLGRMSRDEQIQPLLAQLYGSAVEAFRQVEDQLGVSLNQLLSIPQGEVCLGVVPPESGPPAVILLIDVGDRLPAVDKLLAVMERSLTDQSWARTAEKVGETELVVLRSGPDSDQAVVHCLRGETIVISNNAAVVKSLLAVWDGEKKPTLAENNNFTAIMRRCGGEAEEKPQISFFVDPLEIVRRVAGGNVAGQTFLALLPALGLDGIQGLGGSVAFSTEQYDSLAHFHLSLSNPRKGVMEMLALRQGDLTPEPWVPKDVVSYSTLHWDFPATYNALNTLYDAIRGQGRLAEDVKASLSDPLGVDFKKEVLEAMDGRVSLAGWMVKPARLNSRGNLLGIKLKDAKAFQPTFEKLVARIGPQVKKESLGSVVYYSFAPPERPDNPQRPERPLIRRPDPAIALVGDYVLLTDSTDFLRHAVAVQGDESEQLAGELEFRLVTSRVRALPGGENIGMLTFSRPEEGMRLVYDLATSDTTRQRLASQAENNPVFRALNAALKDNPLPPFSALARYLAPGGGLLTNDETGFHYTSFTLKRK